MSQLTDKVAVVTGAGVRIGRAIALGLAEAGADVCVHYGHSAKAADETANVVRALGRRASLVQADLSDAVASARRIIDHAVTELGRVDILVNNAAVFEAVSLAELDEAVWDRHLAIDLKAACFLCREFALALETGSRGHIVNIADWRAERPVPGHLPYTVAKAGLVALTKLLAVELAPQVQVNAVAPGAILPPPGEDERFLAERAKNIPLRCSGRTEDVVQAVVYLLQSDFVTGEVLHVTGGEQL